VKANTPFPIVSTKITENTCSSQQQEGYLLAGKHSQHTSVPTGQAAITKSSNNQILAIHYLPLCLINLKWNMKSAHQISVCSIHGLTAGSSPISARHSTFELYIPKREQSQLRLIYQICNPVSKIRITPSKVNK
jgi:hypothetical protein